MSLRFLSAVFVCCGVLAAFVIPACVPPEPASLPPLWADRPPNTAASGWAMFHHDPSHAGATPSTPSHDPHLVWHFPIGGEIWGSPAIGPDSTVYIGSTNGKVYAIDGHTGTQRWVFDAFAAVWSGPAIAPDGTVYVTSVDHYLYALRDGQLAWQ